MKWSEIEDEAEVMLIQDFYSLSEFSSDLHYRLLTKSEIDDIMSIAYKKGEIFTFDSIMEHVWNDNGEIGINIDDPVNPKLYQIL